MEEETKVMLKNLMLFRGGKSDGKLPLKVLFDRSR